MSKDASRDSRPGKGARKLVRGSLAAKAGGGSVSEGMVPKGTILLVDDEMVVLEVVSEMLASLGYHVQTATSGLDALRLYKEKAAGISLVVLDMIMPDMGGEEVFRKLKKLNPDVEVLIASGCDMDSQVLRMFEMGCRGFLQKPFHLVGLAEKITAILS